VARSPKERKFMKKYLVAAGLIVAFASPALAADYYVALKVGGGGCVIMDHKPGPKYKNMGSFSSRSMAKKAMHEMSDCK
jgi:opacity protein-like surface antigen